MTIVARVFRQWSGVNGVSFFAPQIFAGVNALGSGNQGSLIAAVIVNGVQLIATIITVFIVDRVGRRTLLISGSVLGFAAEIAVAIVFAVAAGKNAVDLPFGASIAAIVLVSVRTFSAASCLVPNPPVHSCFIHSFVTHTISSANMSLTAIHVCVFIIHNLCPCIV